MVQKRQLTEEEYDVSAKHMKLENSCQVVSCLEFPSTAAPPKTCNSGMTEAPFTKETSKTDCQFESGNITIKPRTLIQPGDTYYCLLRSSPLKEVPIGPEYQATLPEWCWQDATNDENKFLGSSVIPMPESDQTTCNDVVVGRGRTDCFCKDVGSLRCVRQHIMEARDGLKGNIGHERFLALGFDNMGDVVSCKWTEEDEQLFHEVVYSNPVSLGKNFWNDLAEKFPSRTNQEIVSYYFNVFMLQRRAEQNRNDPSNADSDDDEWQGSYPDEDVEDLCLIEIEKYRCSVKDSIFNLKDYDFQDDSCPSSEFQEPENSDVKVDFTKSWTNHDFIFDPSDTKVWDGGYFSFPKNKPDFLPTGSMIEEVFGDESWNFKVTDDNNGSS